MIYHPLLAVGILLISSFWGGRAANLINLPRISGYLVAGMLLSPSFFHVLPRGMIDKDLNVITEMALGIIAFSIGGSLVYERLKHLGSTILWITVIQAVGAFLITTSALLALFPVLSGQMVQDYDLVGTIFPLAIVIGAISAATAPGAILAIVSELRAKGAFTTTLLGVIALDDGLTIIFFAIASAVAHSLLDPGSVSWLKAAMGPVREIGLSLLLGFAAAMCLKLIVKVVRRKEAFLMVVLGILFTSSGIAVTFHLSPLLTNMVLGFIIVNFERRHHSLFLVVEQVEESLFGLFFALAGAHLDLGLLKSAGLLASVILIARMVGKQTGTWIGASISKAPAAVKKYLGLGLFPQAGVTIGLVLVAQEIFPPIVSTIMVNSVIGAVIINEFIAPPLVKYALQKAGAITESAHSQI